MPTYEYRCNECEHQFEEFQSITAKPLRTCPECGKKRLERLIGTGAGIIFKGSGFYETDYRSESYKKAAQKETSNGKARGDSGGGASDSGAARKDTVQSKSRENGAGSESPSRGLESARKSAGSSGSGAKPCGPGCGCRGS